MKVNLFPLFSPFPSYFIQSFSCELEIQGTKVLKFKGVLHIFNIRVLGRLLVKSPGRIRNSPEVNINNALSIKLSFPELPTIDFDVESNLIVVCSLKKGGEHGIKLKFFFK